MMLPQYVQKYKNFFAYAFFGGCTTFVNILCYKLLYFILAFPNILSTIMAWFLAVLFAFITNKIWVFCSKSFSMEILFPELIKFFACRVMTGILDIGIMWFSVDKMKWNAMIWKLFSNILVIVLNYVASRLVIFVKKGN